MEQRNLLIAIVLSVAIIFGFQIALEQLYPERHAEEQAKQQTATGPGTDSTVPRPGGVPSLNAPDPAAERAQALAEDARIPFQNASIEGSLRLRGGRIDDLRLHKYRVELPADSPDVTLLSPAGTANPYFVELGWVSDDKSLALPGPETPWRTDGGELKPGNAVTLTWDNGAGLFFSRRLSVDESYLFEITETVRNTSPVPVTLYPYSIVARTNTPTTLGFYILHEGPIGVLEGTLKEVDYDDLQGEGAIEHATQGGWIGITDKYWLVALIPEQNATAKGRFSHTILDGRDHYQTDLLGGGRTVTPGTETTLTSRVFAGAKEVQVLDDYAETYSIDKFDRAIDFGWFYFLTKPLFYMLIYFRDLMGNFGLSILLLTVIIKLILFPLANKSYRSMSRMKALQPQMMELRERFGDDKQRLNQEMMSLYKREKVNPASGCLPIVVQIPVFFALYKVLFVSIEMRHAPFYGWIQDLSAPDPTTVFNLFGLIPWTPPEMLLIGAWPLIMGVSMFLQQKLNPAPPDPVQARIFMMLPIVFTFLLARFPSGLVIYWAWNNVLSIAQQWAIMRTTKVSTTAKDQSKAKAKSKKKAASDEEETPAETSVEQPGEDEDVAAPDDAGAKVQSAARRKGGRKRSRGGRR